jgi:hypothetical protein
MSLEQASKQTRNISISTFSHTLTQRFAAEKRNLGNFSGMCPGDKNKEKVKK